MVWGVWEPTWGEGHINVLELRAVFLSLKALLPSIQGRHVLVRTDISLHGIPCEPPGGTRLLRCLHVAQTLLFWAAQYLASLRAVYIPGIANQAADLLSRTGPLPGEWRLHLQVVALLWAQFGMACIDLFAAAHCMMWFSLMGGGALWVWMLCLTSGRTGCCMLFPHSR